MRAIICLICIAVAWPVFADSLFTKKVEKEGTLISDKKATCEEGDIITVLVQENIDATTSADTNTKKDASVKAEAPISANPFFVAEPPAGLNIFNPGELPNWDVKVKNEHEATGETSRANRIVTTISCTVLKVYENGNVDIKGDKTVTVNREDSKLHVEGTVRARDVGPGNTVYSNQVANANIELKGQGPLWNNQRRGLLTKILDWFSPF